MAKKSKKRHSRTRVQAVQQQAVTNVVTSPTPKTAEGSSANRAVDLAREYPHVYTDLKRIGVLAVSMFALLVALALLAQYVF